MSAGADAAWCGRLDLQGDPERLACMCTLQAFAASSAERLEKVAEGLGQGLEARCHDAHLRLDERAAAAEGMRL